MKFDGVWTFLGFLKFDQNEEDLCQREEKIITVESLELKLEFKNQQIKFDNSIKLKIQAKN